VSARAAAAALVVVALAGILLTRGSDPYRVSLQLPTAAGLREGADVKVGGAVVGTVASLELGDGDAVRARLDLRDGARIGPDAAAAVKASNLLGDKYLALEPGDLGDPEASGAVIPAARVSFPVELDQILNVLDPQTRVRLAVLLDQAGRAVMGRREDVGQTLAVLGPGLGRVQSLVEDLHADNAALRDTLTTADRWARRFASEREALGQMVDTAAGTMSTVATEHDDLRATLARAPGTLRTARGFLSDLERTTVPLGPAARAITATAPALVDTLDELPAFRRAAQPALASATDVAPALTTLAERATPVLRRAVPAVRSVRGLAEALPPFTRGLDASVDGIMSLMHGWSRAVQTRDGAGHVFRGDFIFGPELLRHALNQLANQGRRAAGPRDRSKAPAPTAQRPAPAAATPTPAATPAPLPKLPGQLGPLLDQVTQGLGQLTKPQAGATDPVTPLLDFLLKP
jgi:virulence factor Mce-like protein